MKATPIHPPLVTSRPDRTRLFLLSVCAGFALGLITTGLLDRSAIAVQVTRQPQPVIALPVFTVGQSLCAINDGLRHIEPLGNHVYTFECADGARFREIEARMK